MLGVISVSRPASEASALCVLSGLVDWITTGVAVGTPSAAQACFFEMDCSRFYDARRVRGVGWTAVAIMLPNTAAKVVKTTPKVIGNPFSSQTQKPEVMIIVFPAQS